MYNYNQLIFPSYMEKDTRFFVIAGFSLNGPVDTPFSIRDGVDPIEVLGDCRMAENYLMAKEYGITPLLLRLNGSHGECEINHEELNTPALRFKTAEATDESNNIHIHLFPSYMIVEGVYNSFSYFYSDYKTMDELVSAIKNELYFGKGEVDVEIINPVPIQGLCLNELYVAMDGADDGFNYVSQFDDSDSEEKVALQLEILKNNILDEVADYAQYTGELSGFQIDTLLFTDIPFEKSPIELPRILGQFAAAKTDEQIGFCSIVLCSDFFSDSRFDEESNDTYISGVQYLLDNAPTDKTDSYLKHVEVVLGTQESVNASTLTMPCAASYACMRYSLPDYYTSATNKGINSISSLINTELKQEEVAKLSSSGYICIVPSIIKGFVPFSSRNLYPKTSIYSKPHYLRSIYFDVDRIVSYFEPYIGESFSLMTIQSLLSQIKSFLDKLLNKHPIYKNITLEIMDYGEEYLKLSSSFELYGEIESVRSSFEYVPTNEVVITWQ